MNRIFAVIIFFGYVSVSCYGLYLIKAAAHWRSFTFAFGFSLYAFGAILWLIILRSFPLSLAFPVAAGSLVLGTMVIGVFFLSENVPVLHVVGALMVFVGICIISMGR